MRFYIILALIFFVLLTNKWMGWNEGMQVLGIPDVKSYQAVAESAPSRPVLIMPYHHAQRLFSPFIVGTLSNAIGSRVESAFYIATYFCIFLTIWIVHKSLILLKLSNPSYAICMSMLLLNPFLFRLYLIVPGMLPDIVFVTGLSLTLYGLLLKRFYLLVAGIIIATLGRQTALLLIPGVMFWLYYGSAWKDFSFNRKTLYATGIALSAGAVYFITGWIVSGVTGKSVNVEHMTGLFRSFSNQDVTVVGVLGYVSYIVLPLLIPLAAITGITIASSGQNRPAFKIPTDVWACLLLAAGIVLQPVLAGPLSTVSQGARLSAFAAIPLIIGVSHLLNTGSTYGVLTAAVLMAGSLHYKYTIVGPATIAQFAILQALAAAMVCAFIAEPWSNRHSKVK